METNLERVENSPVYGPSRPVASQRDRAYDELHRLLLLQQIPEGERLREPEWAQRLGVNRVALREAFARLEAEGFLEKGPRTGYFVPVLTAADVHEILRVRAVLECTAVAWFCAENATRAEGLAALNQVCAELDNLIEIGYLSAASEADRRFHETLVALGGSRRLLKLYGNAPLPMLHGRMARGTDWECECRNTLVEHRAIISAIAANDSDLAQNLLKQHLHGSYLESILN